MKRYNLKNLIMVVILISVFIPYVVQATNYTYTSFNPPNAWNTHARSINDDGTIVGYYDPTDSVLAQGFIRNGTTYTIVSYPGDGINTYLYGINNEDTIVGAYNYNSGGDGPDGHGPMQGFILKGTTYTLLNYPGAVSTVPYGINNNGTIVGSYRNADGSSGWFIFNGTTYTPLNYPGAPLYANYYGINDNGTIVGIYQNSQGGHSGFTLSGTTYTLLSYPGDSYANGINNEGTIAGIYTPTGMGGGTYGYSLSGATYTTLGAGYGSYAYAINNKGLIVGTNVAGNNGYKGFLATPIWTLSVSKTGTGSGTVTSSPAGINCGSVCSAGFPPVEVTLTASPATGSSFTGWSGEGCSGTDTCKVTMNASKNVTVTFADITPPAGTVSINSNLERTNSLAVTLTLTCSDLFSGCSKIQLSNDNIDWSTAAEDYASTKSWNLLSGDGTKTVYVKFKDTAGNWSSPFSASIILDTAIPAVPAPISLGSNPVNVNKPTLTWNAISDPATYTLQYANNPEFLNPVTVPGITGTSYSIPSILSDGTWYWKIMATDLAGNEGEWSAVISFVEDAATKRVPSEYATIQAAIDAAVSDDIVIVSSGSYEENITFQGEKIIVQSEKGANVTFLSPKNNGVPIVWFHSGETDQSKLIGFTLRNGGNNRGSAIRFSQSSPTIENCIIKSSGGEGAISFYYSSAVLKNCLIIDNPSNAFFFDVGELPAPKILNCTIVNNSGTGSSDVIIPPVFKNSIIYGNASKKTFGNFQISYSLVEGGYSGEGNLDVDPLLIDPAHGDYHLNTGSPCIDSGTDVNTPTTDFNGIPRPRGAGFDMGAYEVYLPVQLVSYSPNVTSNNTLTLDWHDVAGASQYRLQYSRLSDFSNNVEVSNITDSTYTFQSALPDGDLFWKVMALDADGKSGWWSRTEKILITTIQNAWITVDKLGDTAHYKLTLNGWYTEGIIPINVAFTTSDITSATVDSDGILTALKSGYVEVSTIYEGKTYKKGLFIFTTFTLPHDAQEIEPNDAKTTANPLTENQFRRGKIGTGSDVDFFKMTLAVPSLVNIGYLSQSSTADVKVELFNASDVLLASGTSLNGQFLMFPLGLSAGDYYLKLSSSGDFDQTNYYIVSYKNLGNLPAKNIVPIVLEESKSGTLYHLTDQTEFTFTLAQEQGIKIVFTPSGDIAKYHLVLLDSNQTAVDQTDCLNQRPVALEAVYGTGSYTLRVTPAGAVDALSPFTVQLMESNSQLEREPNDQYNQATSWNIANSITGRLAGNTDKDFFTFLLESPRYLELSFTSPGSVKNFYLTLYKDSDQNEIDGVTVINGQNTSLHMGLGMGRYYLQVRGNGTDVDTTHPYTLTLKDSAQTNLEIESNNTIKVANAIEKDVTKKGRIYSSTDKDYFGFHLPTVDLVTIQFAPSSALESYTVSMVNENDAVLETATSNNGQAITLEPYQVPGNFYIRIEGSGAVEQNKPYDLTVTSAADIVGIKQLVSVTVSGSQTEMQPTTTQTLIAKAGYSDASATTVTPVWTSLNPAIAAVDGAGSVTAVAEGTTSIVAAFGGLSGKFDLKVGAPLKVVKQHYGNLILVAGGGIAADNTLKESTQYLSDLVYKRFKARLFADEDIYYLNPLPWHDLDGDGYGDNIVDDTSPTVAKFGQAITTWAASQDTDGPLYVYLIDHGGIDNFMIFPNEIITADQLKSYLDTFQTDTERKVVVIIEACKSGSFTDNLIAQNKARIVITSTDDQDSYMQLSGRISFSQFLIDRLLTGDSLNAAYLKAKQQLANMGLPYSKMQPKLVEGGAPSANSIKLGGDFAIASLFVTISETSPSTAITANPSSPVPFYATLSSLEGIEAVWAVVVPPDYIPPSTTGDLSAPQVTLPTFDLTDPEKDKRYEGSYSDFEYNGDYRITFYARNTNGNVSVSPSITVTVTGGLNTSNTLTVTKTGTGDGTVKSNPAGINCGTDCTETYTAAATLTLTAAPDNNSDFAGWSGTGIACPGTGSCSVSVDGAKLVNADFTRKILKGDLNDDVAVNLADAILALKAIGRLNAAGIRADYATSGADVNGDGKIGLAEVIYILQKMAGLR